MFPIMLLKQLAELIDFLAKKLIKLIQNQLLKQAIYLLIVHIILIKTLVEDLPIFQIVFIRSISSSVILMPILFFTGRQKNIFF